MSGSTGDLTNRSVRQPHSLIGIGESAQEVSCSGRFLVEHNSDERVSVRTLSAACRVIGHLGQHDDMLADPAVCVALGDVRQALTDLERRRAGLWWEQASGRSCSLAGEAGTA